MLRMLNVCCLTSKRHSTIIKAGNSKSLSVQLSHERYDNKNLQILSHTVLKLRILFLYLFLNKMLVIKAWLHKMLVRSAIRKYPDQTASLEAVDLGMSCLFR